MSTHTESEFKTKSAFLEGKRKRGYDIGLYRNVEDGKLAGVCAGVADYVEVDKGVLRLIFLASLLFSAGTSMFVYAIAWLFLAPAPETISQK
ncbi:MAG: PspC domain-containing protein [Reinekea sp.]|jgi:phage shock protein C|nr:PspC domain-containing protein [Reinekea sp.]